MKTIFNKPLLVAVSLILSACSQNVSAPIEPRLADEEQSETELLKTEAPPANAFRVDPRTLMRTPKFTKSEKAQIFAKYDHLDPEHLVPTKLLENAVLYFEANESRIANKNYMVVIDFSRKSTLHRFFIIDMNNGSVWRLHTSHGKGSDSNHDGFAERFSNTSGSNATSVGYYLTAETYQGRNGYSLRLDGLSSSNSNARSRAIVVHGAGYVQERTVIQGRSSGCPAVSHDVRDRVINKIKNGALIYAGLSSSQ